MQSESKEVLKEMRLRKRPERSLIPMPVGDVGDRGFVLGNFNLSTHQTKLASPSEVDTIETIWHEQMHESLWEDLQIDEIAVYAWDSITKEISEWLEFTHQHQVSWKTILKWSQEEKYKTPLYQAKSSEFINLQKAKHQMRRN